MVMASFAQGAERVKRIEIRGNRKIEKQAILQKIKSARGKRLSRRTVEGDIRRLHKLGFFHSIRVDFKKGRLVYFVRERPSIKSISFNGNEEINTEDLRELLNIATYGIYDENLVRESVKKIKDYYEDKGFYLAKITHRTKYNKKNDTVNLIFTVKENHKVKVKKITFLGNKAFTDVQLKRVLRNTGEESFFSWLTGSGSFKGTGFRQDMELLQIWYLNEGYVRFSYDPPIITVSEDKKWVYITVKLTEGKQYRVGEVDFSGDLLFPEKEMSSMISMNAGTVFSIIKRNQDALAITEKYQDLGYANTNVIPRMEVDDETLTINIIYEFQKGSLVYFGRISVKGNVKTWDEVIRRELRIKEGELYSGTKVRESKENIIRLGFFVPEKVRVVTNSPHGQPDIVDVEVHVEERPTGQFQLGAGYGTASKFFFTTEVAETNFRGLGQDLRLKAQLSSDKRSRSFTFGLTDPYAFDTNWSVGGDIFYTSSVFPSRYIKKRIGVSLNVGYPIFDYTRLFLGHRLEKISLDEIEDSFVEKNKDREEGLLSALTATAVLDKRNNRWEPSSGHYLKIKNEFAGLGGNRHYLKLVLDARYYKKILGDLVLRTKFEVGTLIATKENGIPSTERFYLGGPSSLKGYEAFTIGPSRTAEDGATFNEGALNKMFYILEFEYPLVKDLGLKLLAFYDAGDAYGNDSGTHSFSLKQDYGWGLRWFSPLGPLRFEWGYPINSKSGNNDPVFHFMIGPPF